MHSVRRLAGSVRDIQRAGLPAVRVTFSAPACRRCVGHSHIPASGLQVCRRSACFSDLAWELAGLPAQLRHDVL